MASSLGTMGKTKTYLLEVKNYRIELKLCIAYWLRTASSTTYIPVFLNF